MVPFMCWSHWKTDQLMRWPGLVSGPKFVLDGTIYYMCSVPNLLDIQSKKIYRFYAPSCVYNNAGFSWDLCTTKTAQWTYTYSSWICLSAAYICIIKVSPCCLVIMLELLLRPIDPRRGAAPTSILCFISVSFCSP
jgi:hypothetical protein